MAVEQTKHIHLDLDADDARVVSDGVVAELQACGVIDTVFVITNEVLSPPQMTIRLDVIAPVRDFRLVQP
jgi:hypothetical protein